MKKRVLIFGLTLSLLLAGCWGGQGGEEPDPTPSQSGPVAESPTAAPDPTPGDSEEPTTPPTETPDERTEVSVAVIKGPTGLGAVGLMADSDAGTTANRYSFTVAADNSEVAGLVTSGQVDIAAMASNLAVSLYNKTDGGVQTIALGTLGVLYILEDGESVTDMDDLFGRTIYATGQGANPEYILRYLLEQHSLEVGVDVNIEWLASDELVAKAAAGQIDLCMLPVPAATSLLIQTAGEGDGPHFREALDLTELWNEANNGSQLTMTSVVASRAFIEENPQAVANFLAEYEASINYVNANVDEAAELAVQYGIVPKAAVAARAIPQANLVCITGGAMQPTIQTYYEILYAQDPASVGGSLPGDGFYWTGQ